MDRRHTALFQPRVDEQVISNREHDAADTGATDLESDLSDLSNAGTKFTPLDGT